jgi:hypothetical protein
MYSHLVDYFPEYDGKLARIIIYIGLKNSNFFFKFVLLSFMLIENILFSQFILFIFVFINQACISLFFFFFFFF